MELARLWVDRRTGTICSGVGSGEQVLKTLHGGLHVLKPEQEDRKGFDRQLVAREETTRDGSPTHRPLQPAYKDPDSSPPTK